MREATREPGTDEACPEGRRGEERSEGEAGDGRDQDPVGGGGGGGPGVLAREEGADGGRERPPLVRAEPVPAAADAGGRDQGRGRGRGLGVALGWGTGGAGRRRGVPQLGHGAAARRICGGCRFFFNLAPSAVAALVCVVSRLRRRGDGGEVISRVPAPERSEDRVGSGSKKQRGTNYPVRPTQPCCSLVDLSVFLVHHLSVSQVSPHFILAPYSSAQ